MFFAGVKKKNKKGENGKENCQRGRRVEAKREKKAKGRTELNKKKIIIIKSRETEKEIKLIETQKMPRRR